jgi:BirA family biotin operon repressor/biotin-[acetyl-CoA-carboxylase] ligase
MRFDIRSFDTVTSTMDLAIEAAETGAAEGYVVTAEEQTSGRGRRGRVWASPPGVGVYLSIVLHPRPEVRSGRLLALLTLAAGVAVREAVRRVTGIEARLKWPNDVLIGPRKVAGILAEGINIGTSDQIVVLGVGVNVGEGVYLESLGPHATSLERESNRRIDSNAVRDEVLAAVANVYEQLSRGEADDILRAWRAAAPGAVGAKVEWEGPDGTLRGTTNGIDDTGALLVRTATEVHRVIGGELRWL